MANFDKAFTKTIKAEGGYVNNPNDKGGETYLGITRKYHSDSPMWSIIDKVKNENPKLSASKLTAILKKNIELDNYAKEIYKTKYWDKVRGDEINSQRVAEQLFDMGVNAGVARAINIMCDVVGEYPKVNTATDSFINAVNSYGKRKRNI